MQIHSKCKYFISFDSAYDHCIAWEVFFFLIFFLAFLLLSYNLGPINSRHMGTIADLWYEPKSQGEELWCLLSKLLCTLQNYSPSGQFWVHVPQNMKGLGLRSLILALIFCDSFIYLAWYSLSETYSVYECRKCLLGSKGKFLSK